MTTLDTVADAGAARVDCRAQLENYFQQVDQLLLQRQDPVTGLFPASTAVSVHGDYTDAWVRDNVYSIQAAWGLALAYRKAGVDNARAYLLEQTVVKLMRGLLLAMMRQAGKVERFKQTQDPLDALHAKYGTRSGDVVVADDKWGHLQLDATSLYLLMLAQMSRAGLRIIFNLDEVSFVQNLVHYIGRAYRTPDYGIWERGNKINNGRPEINASSVGMAKAALEAMRGLDLFGQDGDARSTIHVVADEIARSRAALQSLLPRESLSKEVDAALLSVISYPAFAVEDDALALRTREQVIAKLAGPYGLKRFLLDGHQTVIEDNSRLHYEDDELRSFANIESEWPLFYCYLLLDALFRQDPAQVRYYRDKLQSLTVLKNGMALLPELYYVPESAIAAERAAPGSQPRVANHNLPLIWAQSLYLLGNLLADGLLQPEDIDPLRRHQRRPRNLPTIRLAVIAENAQVKQRLSQAGIAAQTTDELPDIRFAEADDLSRILQELGANPKLGLSGRPFRRLRSLATAQGYRIDGRLHLFFGQYQNPHSFYLAVDNSLLIEQFRAELSYVARHWDQPGAPVLLFKLRAVALDGEGADAVIAVLRELQSGQCAGIGVELSTVSDLLTDLVPVELAVQLPAELPSHEVNVIARCYYLPFDPIQSRSNLPDAITSKMPFALLMQQLMLSQKLPEQLRIMQALANHYGLDQDSGMAGEQPLPLRQLVKELYHKAASIGHWAALRFAAGLLDKTHAGLEDAVAELIARQRQVVFGRAVASYVTVSAPLANDKIHALMRQHTGRDPRECLLNQEVLVYLVMQVRAKPELLQGLLSIRTSHLLLLMISQLAAERGIAQDAAFELLCTQAPHEVFTRLKAVLEQYQTSLGNLARNERLHFSFDKSAAQQDEGIKPVEFLPADDPQRADGENDWRAWRNRVGVVNRHPDWFHTDIWHLLKHCDGIVLGDRYERSNLLDTKAVHDATTPGEPAFALQFESLLNELPDPAYRHLNVEALMALTAMFRANPSLVLNDRIVLDALLSYAVKFEWLAQHPDHADRYNEFRSRAWDAFYLLAPHRVANAVIRAVEYLLEETRLPAAS
ncbi:glycosyl hydrolase family 15 [Permianibacter sp. IMCC34836]|uniref:glycoside hydrolase family 15 protein n=1 Tax=Permianibacter fluminis TaxID=2738515 RepID=UPI0015573667|nr:glycoside hydrolase family 15 protein [Permianibacter fluminis]NQD37498.1 glycosyl hydrolase family 15 [Permianibacter fluminis]